MKAKILYSLFAVVVFASGLFTGIYAGISSGASSNSTEVYNSATELAAIHRLIEAKQYEDAKQVICDSVKVRVHLLEMSRILMNERRSEEVYDFKHAVKRLFEGSSLDEACV